MSKYGTITAITVMHATGARFGGKIVTSLRPGKDEWKNHEAVIDGEMLVIRRTDGKGAVYALPMSLCSLEFTPTGEEAETMSEAERRRRPMAGPGRGHKGAAQKPASLKSGGELSDKGAA